MFLILCKPPMASRHFCCFVCKLFWRKYVLNYRTELWYLELTILVAFLGYRNVLLTFSHNWSTFDTVCSLSGNLIAISTVPDVVFFDFSFFGSLNNILTLFGSNCYVRFCFVWPTIGIIHLRQICIVFKYWFRNRIHVQSKHYRSRSAGRSFTV